MTSCPSVRPPRVVAGPDERPRYIQIIEHLRRRLATKEWEPGTSLPGESTLAREYGVSHGTVRKAVDYLVGQNILVRFQGKGTYVATHAWQRASHFLPMVDENGVREEPAGHVETVIEDLATEAELQRLELRAGSKVIRIKRVRSLGGKPAVIEHICLPARRFESILSRSPEELSGLLYGLYEKDFGMTVVEVVEKLRGTVADADDAALLHLPKGYGLLQIERLALDIKGKPVELRFSRCDTTDYHYENRIT